MNANGSDRVGYRSQRVVDVIVASFVGLVTAPLVFIAGIAIVLTSPGPVLYRARRVGRHGAEFDLYKLRSMRIGTTGPVVTAASDDRITPVGRWIRLTKVDELPQLVNVLRGDMSIVGPRPEDPLYVAAYDRTQAAILDWKPGITSPASLAFRHEETLLAAAVDQDGEYRRIMAEKLRIDLAYLRRASLRGDLGVMLDTVRALVRRRPQADAAEPPAPIESSQ